MTTTNNLAADMISACLAHYKNRSIKHIRLSKSYWRIFLEYLKQVAPEQEYDHAEQIQFNNVTILKGHAFMVEKLEVEFGKPKALA